MGAQCASFGPARRERGLWRGVPQSNATARRFGSFLKLATTQQFCNFCLREAARRSFFRSTASPQRRDTLYTHTAASCASQQQRTAVFSSALLFGPKPVLTAPVISAETATNQQQSPRSTPRRRPQPLRDVRARGQHRAANKTAQASAPPTTKGRAGPTHTKGSPGGGVQRNTY